MPLKAIIIDDDIPTVDVVAGTINWDKFDIDKVYHAYNADEAKKLFLSEQIDLAVCDIEMPKESGLDLLEWVRERHYRTQFIFLTSHERFDYASLAIHYNASGYVVKPFNAGRMEQELFTAIGKIHREEEIKKAEQYRNWIEKSGPLLENGFWLDLFEDHILAERENIEGEIRRRHLSINVDEVVRFVLVSSGRTDNINETWNKDTGLYEYALAKLEAEILQKRLSTDRIVNYQQRDRAYSIVILPRDEANIQELRASCERLTEAGEDFLRNQLTCYISGLHALWKLTAARLHLEEQDRNNVASRGGVFTEDEEIVMTREAGHILDQDQIRALLAERKTKELLNLLKLSIKNLTAKHMIDTEALQEIRQDLLQSLYVYLNDREILATQLFLDPLSVQMERKATDSVMDMMRWQIYVVTKTQNYVEEVEHADSIANKVKLYISRHYRENITRTTIAESVFLTPEYMAKIFKKEIGMSVRQFLAEYRVGKAKELLARPNIRISDVAQKVGFDNFSYFSTVFKKVTGKTPNDYHTEIFAHN